MKYALLWSRGGRQAKAVLDPGEHFLGRLTEEDAAIVDDPDPFTIYIITSGPRPAYVNTGIRSLAVSRRHAKLVVRSGGVGVHPALLVYDHGPSGKGSKNGTYVNGEKLRPGEGRHLFPGDALRLGADGPVFVVGTQVGGETIVRAPVGVPKELPRETAEALQRAGLVAERKDIGEVSLVVLSKSDVAVVDEGLRIEITDLGQAVAVSRVLMYVVHTASIAIESIARDRMEEAINRVHGLDLETVEKALASLKDTAVMNAYRDLIQYVKLAGEGAEADTLEKKLKLLREKVLAAYQSLRW